MSINLYLFPDKTSFPIPKQKGKISWLFTSFQYPSSPDGINDREMARDTEEREEPKALNNPLC